MSDKFDSKCEASDAFMQEAAKHFVCLTNWESKPGKGADEQQVASCFVIETSGAWFLVTAGHVIQGIKQTIAAGIRLYSFNLNDGLAHRGEFEFSLPYDFQEDQWIVIEGDPRGTDYAAAPIRSFSWLAKSPAR